MSKLPRKISGKELLKAFRELGFQVIGQRSSHVFLRHPDGRRLTIPVYSVVPVNLLNWILAEAKITREEFLQMSAKKLGISVDQVLTPAEIKKTRPRLRGATAETLVRRMREQRDGGRLSRY